MEWVFCVNTIGTYVRLSIVLSTFNNYNNNNNNNNKTNNILKKHYSSRLQGILGKSLIFVSIGIGRTGLGMEKGDDHWDAEVCCCISVLVL